MPFIVLLAEAKASRAHASFEPGSLHSVVAVVRASSLDAAQEAVDADLREVGFSEVELSQARVVPAWLRFLPTSQGRALRQAWKYGASISVFEDDNRDS